MRFAIVLRFAASARVAFVCSLGRCVDVHYAEHARGPWFCELLWRVSFALLFVKCALDSRLSNESVGAELGDKLRP
jgi:hypothetical protein